MIRQFCTPYTTCLNIGYWQGILYKNVAFSIIILSTKKRCSSFFKKNIVFQKTCFKVKVLKTFKISSDCHLKICWSLERWTILKIPSAFSCVTTKINTNFPMKLVQKSSCLFSIYLMNYLALLIIKLYNYNPGFPNNIKV